MSLRAHRVEGYVIISADGMIANAAGIMPDELKNQADQRFFQAALDQADVLVHGRHSHEGGPHSPRRRRLIVTRSVAAIAPDPANAKALFWNPAGTAYDAACRAIGVPEGVVAIIGGPEVFRLFLEIGYDAFHLSQATRVRVPGGLPIFPRAAAGRAPEEMLARHGLEPGQMQDLDAAAGVTLVTWRRPAAR
jgi:dihydrofolate reductase